MVGSGLAREPAVEGLSFSLLQGNEEPREGLLGTLGFGGRSGSKRHVAPWVRRDPVRPWVRGEDWVGLASGRVRCIAQCFKRPRHRWRFARWWSREAQETGAPSSPRHAALGTLRQQSSGVRERRDADRDLWAEAAERARARRVPRGFGEIPSSASGAGPSHATREPGPQSRGPRRSPPSRRRAICRRRIHARLWNSCTACTALSTRSRGSRSGRCLSTYPSSNATVAQSALS